MQKIILSLVTLFVLAGCSSIEKYTPINLGGSESAPEPQILSTEEDNSLFSANEWRNSINSLSPENQSREAERVYTNANTPPIIKERAMYVVATRPGSMTLFAQQNLARDYANADLSKRANMERVLAEELRSLNPDYLQELGEITPRVQETTFPWILFVYEAARANLLQDNVNALARLNDPALFANPSIFGFQDPNQEQIDPAALVNMQNNTAIEGLVINPNPRFSSVCVSMLLPLSGSFQSIGNQVKDGAVAAKEVMALSGVNVTVHFVDSENPSWMQTLSSLPQTCVMVGGPLRSQVLEQAHTSGITNSKAFFAFSSQLPSSMVEGVNAWRFFTSPEDQLDAVLDYSVNDLAIHDYASFYPDDAYGIKMSELFAEDMRRRNFRLSQVSYPLEDQSAWTEIAGDLLSSVERETADGRKKLPLVTAPIGAIFVPDGFSNMEMISSVMLYQGAVDIPIFGTNLWEQSLQNKKDLKVDNYKLLVFPGEFDKTSRMYGALQLQRNLLLKQKNANAWSALGYDFIQMAAALEYRDIVMHAPNMNQKLSFLQPLAWAAAPFKWDYTGKAKRSLFLFQPAADGISLLDKEAFKQYLLDQNSSIR